MSIVPGNIDPPRMPEQQADISPGSAPAILAIICELIRERFRSTNNLAWYYDENPTPQPTEDNDIDGPRKITILPAFAVDSDIRNFKPAIYVDRDTFSAQQVAVGNTAYKKLNTGATAYYAHGNTTIDLEIVGNTPLESTVIADIVWFYLLSGRDVIRSTLGFRDMSLPVISNTVPSKDDKTTWVTHVTFSVQVNLRWITVPISPILREIALKYQRSGETNPDTYLLAQYLR